MPQLIEVHHTHISASSEHFIGHLMVVGATVPFSCVHMPDMVFDILIQDVDIIFYVDRTENVVTLSILPISLDIGHVQFMIDLTYYIFQHLLIMLGLSFSRLCHSADFPLQAFYFRFRECDIVSAYSEP